MNGLSHLEELIAHSEISMKTKRVPLNPILGAIDLCEGVDHYHCYLSRPGRKMDVFLSVHPSEGTLSLMDVLSMLAMDASGCKMMEGYDNREEWPSLFFDSKGKMKEIEWFWQEYRGRCKQTKKLRNFLGESDYQELIQCFEFEQDLAGNF